MLIISLYLQKPFSNKALNFGIFLQEMAEDYPQAEFHLIDLSSSLYLSADRTKPHNCYFKAHNALDRLPFEDDTFDFIHHRGMGLAYREEDWGRVMNELYRILKPGGWIELCESDVTIYRYKCDWFFH